MQLSNRWLAKNVFITLTTSLMLLGMGMATGILTARLLGPEGKGQLTAVTIWPSMLAALGSLGITEAVKYYTAAHTGKRKFVFANSIYFALAQSMILVSIGFLFVKDIHQGSGEDVLLAGKVFLLFIPLNLFNLYMHHFLAGRSDFGAFNIIRVLISGSILTGIIILAMIGRMTVLNAVVVYLVGNLVTLLVLFLFVVRTREIGFKFSRGLALPMLVYGVKAHSENVGNALNERLDQLLISILLAPIQLGYYAAAVTLSTGVLLVGNSVSIVAMPVIASQEYRYDRKSVFILCFKYSFWLSVLSATFFVVMTPVLIRLFFGQEFIPAILVARIMAVAAIFLSMNKILQAGLKAINHPLKAGVSELLALIAMVFLLILLLPRLGILGAAIASMIAYGISFSYMVLMVIRHLDCRFSELLTLRINDMQMIVNWIFRPFSKFRIHCLNIQIRYYSLSTMIGHEDFSKPKHQDE